LCRFRLSARSRNACGLFYEHRAGGRAEIMAKALLSWFGGAEGASERRVHDLRHTYASVLASAGLSPPVIGALLGHATPVTTARYSHLFDDTLRAATERADATTTADIVLLLVRK
jgi:integrase